MEVKERVYKLTEELNKIVFNKAGEYVPWSIDSLFGYVIVKVNIDEHKRIGFTFDAFGRNFDTFAASLKTFIFNVYQIEVDSFCVEIVW